MPCSARPSRRFHRWPRLPTGEVLVDWFRLLTGEVLLDRSGSGSGILSLNLPGWCGTFDPTSSLDPLQHFQGVTILGLQRVCTDQILANLLAGGYNMRERGETGEHATKVTDVRRKRVVAWWGQYGEKLAETNSDLISARQKRKTKCFRKILVPRRQTLLATASSLDGPAAAWAMSKCYSQVPFQAH